MRKILLLYLMIGNMVCAQVGIGTTSPSAGAMLDINSTTSGLLIPRMTQVQRNAIGSPTTGLLIYQTDNTPGFYYYNGSAWTTMGSDNLGNHIATQNVRLSGNWISDDGTNRGLQISNSWLGINTLPNVDLHVHRPTGNNTSVQITNTDTGTGVADGFLLEVASDERARIINRENTTLSIGTNNTERMIIEGDGDIGIGGSTENTSLVTMNSTSKGLLIPRMTYSNRINISSPATGLMVYQTDAPTPGFYYYNGSSWALIGDNLGNHTATQNVQLNSQWLSNDGGNEGINITNDGNIGINSTPHSSVILDMSGTANNQKGVRFPQMSQVSRDGIATPVQGMLIYQWDNTPGIYLYNGSAWEFLGSDNLGNHTATSNIQLNSNYLSGDGGNEGIFVDATGNIGIGTNTPDASSLLTMNATNKGILIPRMTQTQRNAISSPATGLLIYQTDNTPGFYYYNGSAWTPSAGGDNLGNHTATQNVNLDNNWLSNNGGTAGIRITNAGNIGINTTAPSIHLGVGDDDTGLNGAGAGAFQIVNNGVTTATITANQKIGLGTTVPNASAILDISSTTEGILIPRMTQAQRDAISSPAVGLLIYQGNGTPGFYYFNGSAWGLIGGDNLGNHTASQNIQLSSQWLSNDGGNEGINIANNGNVGINVSTSTIDLGIADNDTGIDGAGSGAFRFVNNGITTATVTANQRIGLGTTTPNASAKLDVSSTTEGVLIPRMTQTQRNAISTPATGLLMYQTDNTPGFYYYNGTAWTSIGNDNLGNHTATENVQLGSHWLSGDGGNEGITINTVGDVGIGTTTPGSGAILDITATDGGILIPRMTLAQRNAIGSPATGLQIFQTDNTPGFYYYNGTTWTSLGIDNLGNHIATQNIQLGSNWLSNDGDNEGIAVTTNGSVGFGTTSASENLQIHESSAASNFIGFTDASTGSNTTTDGTVIGILNDDFYAWNRENNHIRFGTNNTERLIIQNDGNIGIGTTATTELNIGDNDTGIDWISNGNYNLISDNTTIANVGSSGLFVRPQLGTIGLHELNIGDTDTGFDWTSDGNFRLLNNNVLTMSFTGNNRVGIGNTTPDASSILDIASTSSGMLTPRMTQTQRDAITTPATGLLVYQTDNTPGFYYYNGSAWTAVGNDNLGNHTASQNVQLAGNWLSNDGGNEGITVTNNGNVGIGTTATTEVNIGDNDTGIDWISDGNYNLIANNTIITNVDSSGLLVRPQHAGSSTSNYELTIGDDDTGIDWTSDGNFNILNNNIATATFTANQRVGIGNTTPDASAIVDIASTTRGMLTPRMTQTQRDAITTPTTGLLVYQTDNTPGFYHYNGSSWIPVGGNTSGWALTGNAGTTAANFIGTTDSQNFAIRTNNTERITVEADGDIGIGTTTPTDHLHLHEATATTNFIGFTDATTGTSSATDGSVVGILNDDLFLWNRENQNVIFGANNVERMRINNAGNVGIGTTAPTNAKLQIVGSTGNYSASGRWFYGGAGIATFSAVARPHSILADGYIATETGFLAYSDERIKKDISTRSTKNDLDLINQLNVVDYNYTDYRTYGDRNNIGFIAQEIKKVMPDAIKVQEEFIPNIYTVSYNVITDTNKTIIKLEKKYDVKIGDKLKLIVPDKGEQIVDIIQVKGNNITTSPIFESPEKVFVYGKQVDDFLAVEYDDIFTLSISAIQELSKQIEALKKENKVLKEENVALHQKIEQIDSLSAKIAQIQDQLSIEHTTLKEESKDSQNNK